MSHSPALDGLRGLAVLAVVTYHAGLGWAAGGFLGVELFFVLSGFLITSLLLVEWRSTARVRLAEFWGRRARRLLPALLAMVAVVGLYYALAGPEQTIPGLRNDGLSTLLYAGNWHQISTGSSYFAASGPVSPLQHTWSLAIEEQFYVLWPLALPALLWLAGRRTRTEAARRRSLRALLALTVLGALGSALDMALLYDGGHGLDRVYYGTDTRASGLLLGAALAIWRTMRGWRSEQSAGSHPPLLGIRRRRLLDLGATSALALIVALVLTATGGSRWLYPYGLLALDVAAVAVIAAVVARPWSPVGRLLAWRPLRGLGLISYGVYLWHFPLFQWLDESSTGLAGTPLLALRLAAALGVSLASYVLIEQPIRRRRVPRVLVRSLAPVAAAGAVACLLLGSALSSVSFSAAAVRSLPRPAAGLQGTAGPCPQRLSDSAALGLAPLPAATAAKTEYAALGNHSLTWRGSATVDFRTCPPARVLVVGDSIAYTIGVGLMENEQRYGTLVANAGILGCAFTTTGEPQVAGRWEGQSAGCAGELATWSRAARTVGARAVVVELGYRDLFDWRIGGHVEHLGQPGFDARLQRQIDRYADVLGAGGRRVVFLAVPWSRPPANPDGSAGAAASPTRHALINAMLRRAARGRGNVSWLDIDRVVSAHGHYEPTLASKLCRIDGVHFTLYCGEALQPYVLGDVRAKLNG